LVFNSSNVGSILYQKGNIHLHPNLRKVSLKVYHCGDRPIQIGSHFHFFEVNKALKFDREKAFGMHLDVPSGTAIRLEPGEEMLVNLVEFSGNKRLIGFNQLTMGEIEDDMVKARAISLARSKGYLFADEVERDEV